MSILLEALKKAQEEKALSSSSKEISDIPSEKTKASSSSDTDNLLSEEDLAMLLSRAQKSKNSPRESSGETVQLPSEQNEADSAQLGLSSNDLNVNHQGEVLPSNPLEINEEAGDFSLSELTLSKLNEKEAEENPESTSPTIPTIKEETSDFLSEGVSLTLATPDVPLFQEKVEEDVGAVISGKKDLDHSLDTLSLFKEEGGALEKTQESTSLSQGLEYLLHQVEEVNHEGVEKNISEVEPEKAEDLASVESGNAFHLEVPRQAESESRHEDKNIEDPERSIEAGETEETPSFENKGGAFLSSVAEVERQQAKTEAAEGRSDASYDWSLSQIPGFDVDSDVSGSEVNKARECKNFVSLFKKSQQSKPDYQKKKGRLKKWLMFAVTAPVFLALAGYFGWEYSKILQTEVSSEVVDYQNKLERIQHEISEKLEIRSQEENTKSVAVKSAAEDNSSKNKVALAADSSSMAKSTQAKSPLPLQQEPKPIVQARSELAKQQSRQQETSAKKVEHGIKSTSKPSTGVQIQSQIEKDLRLQAFEAFEKGEYAKAQQLYRSAALKHPKDINVWLGLGASSLALGEQDAALKYYRQALKQEPSNTDALKAVAMLIPKKDQNWVTQVITLHAQRPNDPDINFMLGSYYSKQGDWLQAEKYLKKAVALSSSSAEILLNYAVSLDQLGRYSMAKDYYQKALAVANGQLSSATLKSIKNRIQLLEQFLLKTQQNR